MSIWVGTFERVEPETSQELEDWLFWNATRPEDPTRYLEESMGEMGVEPPPELRDELEAFIKVHGGRDLQFT